MSEKRYAIVRVDGEFSCPSQYENIEDEYVCKDGCYPKRSCNNGKVLYGDTKKQLIIKILQVMMRKYTISYLRTTRQDKINPKHFKSAIDYYLETAKEIVGFLGVE